jgi:hypothetical protein
VATTSIWAVKGWLGKALIYVENPEKTDNPAFFESRGIAGQGDQGLSDVIEYAAQTGKTQEITQDEGAEVMRRFVSGVNCRPASAREEMLAVKAHFGKTDGVVAYHGYQSFAPNEVTPETAHEIGIKLAEKLWGDRFQVIVATHLDKANHLHNHFVVNNVSMIDGGKYYRSERDYYNMQKESDALCREYRLSVIEEPERGKSKHYAEHTAEREGCSTWRSLVKSDVDAAIIRSVTERQFFDNLKNRGYAIKVGKDISVRPPGKERFVRLRRNFGEDYAIEGIRRRILAQTLPARRYIPPDPPPKRFRVTDTIHKARKLTGLRALYFHYLHKMGALPRRRERQANPKQVYFLFREDIRHMRNIARETRLLAERGIDTYERLTAHREELTARMAELFAARKRLRYKSRNIKDDERPAAIKSEISALSEQIAALRREVRLCESIETRSGVMRDKIRTAREHEKSQGKTVGKERNPHEPFRGRR